MVDLLMIHPGAAHGIYGALGDELTAVEPPLWCRLIAAYCRDRGHSVRILDAEALGMSARDVGHRVESMRPRLICIAAYGHQPSASTQQMAAASAIASSIRSNLSCFGPIIMVGGHVAALPERTMREEAIDFVCAGEGPVTVERLLAWLKRVDPKMTDQPSDVPGLMWREGDRLSKHKLRTNAPAPLIEDMGALHGNAWDLLPMGAYRAHNWQCFGALDQRKPYASIMTSLGCPYRCAFCCINAPFASNRYRMRSPEAVVAEIVLLFRNWGITTFKIIDEMFILNDRHYTEIATRLIDTGFADRLNIWAYARVDTVKAGTLTLLRRAGFRWLALGIESGSEFVRDGAEKRMRTSDITGVVRAIQAADINVIANYIFGLPDDDQASMQATLDMAMELNTEFANFYSAMAYPGSRLYTEAVTAKAALPASWRGYSQHNDDCRPLDTKHIPGAEVLRFRDLAFIRYFNRPEYVEMIRAKFGDAAVAHITQMLAYKLERKLLGGIAA